MSPDLARGVWGDNISLMRTTVLTLGHHSPAAPSSEGWEVKESVPVMAVIPLFSTVFCKWQTLDMFVDWMNEWISWNKWMKMNSRIMLGWWVTGTAFTQPPTSSAPLSPSKKTVKLSGPVVIQGTIFLNVAFFQSKYPFEKNVKKDSRWRSFFKRLQWLKSSYSKYLENCICLKKKKNCCF